MQLHGGRIEVLDGSPGALFRISFPTRPKKEEAPRKGC